MKMNVTKKSLNLRLKAKETRLFNIAQEGKGVMLTGLEAEETEPEGLLGSLPSSWVPT